jgi:GWxTD domain-containing protein
MEWIAALMRTGLFVCLTLGTGAAGCASASGGPQDEDRRQRQAETNEDYYTKWLKQDVIYIITEQEREIFEKLSNLAEKEAFIEQFWRRRDPEPRTPNNEFKEEHYRRIAYANERFAAGWPGWMTDRGKVYIIHGPPNEIEEYPSGGTYERPLHEGGGTTATYPFEIWRYNHIEGFERIVELQFVDRDSSGEYRLALSPEEKDAFLFVPNAGFTLAESLGMAERRQRPYFSPGGSYPLMNYRIQDTPFARYETFVNVQRPLQIKYKDLKESVDLNVTYNELPFRSSTHYFRLNEDAFLAPITLEIQHQDLTFKKEPMGGYHAKVAIYGRVTSIKNQVVSEFEDDLVATLSEQEYTAGTRKGSLYQRMIVLRQRDRYKLDLVVKDVEGNQLGARQSSIALSAGVADRLSASSVMVCDLIVPVDEQTPPDAMFVLGDVRVRPSLSKSFRPADYFAVYLQLYNVAISQVNKNPAFKVTYRLRNRDGVLSEQVDEQGESVQYFSPQRMVLIKRLPLTQLPPGSYDVEVLFEDQLRQETITAKESFQVVTP